MASDYDSLFRERIERLKRLREGPELLPGIKEHYRSHPVDFINDWCLTFDPRNPEVGLPAEVPFILFPKQEEFVEWVVARWQAREDGLAEKSRDMGVSWLCCAIAVWMWLFYKGTVIGFGSRKEEYVDKIGDPKSLFWKVRQLINGLPSEFWPVGYEERKHAPHMRIMNPENGAVIVGEAGDNIGRGNRTSVYFKDESAFYEHPELIDAALSQTSNCKIDVSTPNGNGNPFYRKRHSGKIPVFTFHWRDDPRKDDDWYRKQCETLDPVIVAQEIDIDYNASAVDAWISGTLVEAAQQTRVADVTPIGGWIISIDAAHEGNDETIIHARRGRLNLPQKAFRGIDGVAIAAITEDWCRELESTGGYIFSIVIELDGPGVSCYDQLRRGAFQRCIHGVHTGARLKDGRNYNLRALMWRRAKDYLENAPVCMDRDPEIKAQLASMRYEYRDGLLLMQNKAQYKKDFGRSPDRADAFILGFYHQSEGREPSAEERLRLLVTNPNNHSVEYDPFKEM